MRKLVLLLLVINLFFITACSQITETTSENESGTNEEPIENINEEEQMFQLQYDATNRSIIQIDPDGNHEFIASDSASEPILSPNQKMVAYINPLEWEVPGSLYLYNLTNGTNSEVIQPMENDIPKNVEWIDDNNLAVIIGFLHGTVSVGGNVYIYNIPDETLKQVTFYDNEIQITEIIYNNNELKLTGIKYIDDNFNEYEEFEDVISVEELFSTN